jgi:hypothetical protein
MSLKLHSLPISIADIVTLLYFVADLLAEIFSGARLACPLECSCENLESYPVYLYYPISF